MMQTGELMEIALKAGEILLTSGAEIYRVEDTITRICSSYNAQCESFVLPTGIFISIKEQDGQESLTAVKRIRQRTVDLSRIDMVNSFSRSLKDALLDYNEAINLLKKIENQKGYNFPTRVAAAGAAGFVFTLLFKGGVDEGIAAILLGMLIYIIKDKLSKAGFFQFFELFTAGLIAGAASVFAVLLFPHFNMFKIIIGSIMLFLPGVAITNSIKDALHGDLVASLSRLGEAVFVAVAVGAGVGIALTIGVKWG
jgi:uncharacterized membrane protein YjjP (DUF1212 family)